MSACSPTHHIGLHNNSHQSYQHAHHLGPTRSGHTPTRDTIVALGYILICLSGGHSTRSLSSSLLSASLHPQQPSSQLCLVNPPSTAHTHCDPSDSLPSNPLQWQTSSAAKTRNIVHMINMSHKHTTTPNLRPAYLTTTENPACYTTDTPSSTPLIVDSGASICITPHWQDFLTYHTSML